MIYEKRFFDIVILNPEGVKNPERVQTKKKKWRNML